LILVTLVAAGLYTWALDASGYGNEYYAAAAYSGSMDWMAWLFGSVDTASFISVDKPPLSLWVTGLSVRIFGLSAWSVLLPHAVAGGATVIVLHHTVRRWHGHAAALGAALAMTITPIAVVMFRYNNPDAILTLLVTGALALAYSAARSASWWRLAASGALVGLAFLTKTTQSLLVIPAIGIVYLVAAPTSLPKRALHLLGAGAAAVVSAGWWVLLAETSGTAPYFGQTDTGSFLDYVFGYNGVGRVTGDGVGPGDPFGGGGGWLRLFNVEVGGQVSWLIPMAAVALVVGMWMRRGHPRTDPRRAGWLLWGIAFVTHYATFSLVEGVFHPYYTLTIAPAVAALAGAGAVVLWRSYRDSPTTAWLLPVTIVVTAAWAAALLSRTPDYLPGLGTVLVVLGLAAALTLAVLRYGPSASPRIAMAAATVAAAVALAGPASYALASIGTDYSGGDPKAGPGENGRPAAAAPGTDDRPQDGPRGGDLPPRPLPPDQALDEGPLPGADGPLPGGDGARDPITRNGIVDYLLEHRGDETWMVAAVSANLAAPLILETGEPVMAMGGFSGGDPTPTSEELAQYIASGELRFVLLTGDRNTQQWERVATALCGVVDAAEYGGAGQMTLYDCVGSASS
jgi:4-amino-4-deoxy-L-arabinose transferase-like glycosyltransferase